MNGARATICLLAALLLFSPPAICLDEAELAALLEAARADKDMPGLRAAVRLRDGRIVRAAVGLADREAGTPLDDAIGMPGGSTGKTFVAALAMLLVEDGTLSLDDHASKYLAATDWFHRLPNAGEIRVRHLLSHSAGIKDYINTAGFQFSMIGRVLRHGSAYYAPEELIEFVLDKRPEFPPGEGYHYSDAGYLVLGLLIEAATGTDYYELLNERILVPQGLPGIRPQNESAMQGVATGYMGRSRAQKKDGRMKFVPRSEWTGGGLITNPTMLVRFFGALAEGRVASPASVELMVESGWRDPESPGWHYGFGLFVKGGGESFSHGGLWPGYRTHVTHYVASGKTVAVQSNRDGRLDLGTLVDDIAALP